MILQVTKCIEFNYSNRKKISCELEHLFVDISDHRLSRLLTLLENLPIPSLRWVASLHQNSREVRRLMMINPF